jgi:hypothetical protein
MNDEKKRIRRNGEGSIYVRGDKYWVKYYPNIGRKPERIPTGHPQYADCGGPVFAKDKDARRKAEKYLANAIVKVRAEQLSGPRTLA